jgi:hypothetical protein
VTAPQESSRLSEQDVAHFLQQNPDFFDAFPQLLADIKLQHESGKAVSLIERQVAVLRDQKKKLKRQLQDLLEIARANDELDQRLHQLTLRLIDCKRVGDVLDTLRQYLSRDFAVEAVTVRLRALGGAGPREEFVAASDAEFEQFARLIGEHSPVCGRFKAEQMRYLFGAQADAIGSAALIPLHDGPVFGLLAVGAKDAQRFHAGQGTVFLSQLGELVGRALRVCVGG